MMMMGEGSTATDRRQHVRHTFNRRVAVRLSRWSSLEGVGCDISKGGIRLQLPYSVNTGERLTVGLTLPNDLQLSLDAEVRFVAAGRTPGGCVAGLRWVDAASDDVLMLSQLIANLQAQVV